MLSLQQIVISNSNGNKRNLCGNTCPCYQQNEGRAFRRMGTGVLKGSGRIFTSSHSHEHNTNCTHSVWIWRTQWWHEEKGTEITFLSQKTVAEVRMLWGNDVLYNCAVTSRFFHRHRNRSCSRVIIQRLIRTRVGVGKMLLNSSMGY